MRLTAFMESWVFENGHWIHNINGEICLVAALEVGRGTVVSRMPSSIGGMDDGIQDHSSSVERSFGCTIDDISDRYALLDLGMIGFAMARTGLPTEVLNNPIHGQWHEVTHARLNVFPWPSSAIADELPNLLPAVGIWRVAESFTVEPSGSPQPLPREYLSEITHDHKNLILSLELGRRLVDLS